MPIRMAAAAISVIKDPSQASRTLERHIEAARKRNCTLIIFPEAIIGGLDISGYFALDKHMAMELDSPVIDEIRGLAAKHSTGIGFGFLELHGEVIYNSYLLINNKGATELHYRRISDTWLLYDIDLSHYSCGDEIPVLETSYGRLGVILCGDLFDEGIVKRLGDGKPEVALHPMARAFPLSDDIQKQWDETEFPYYLAEYEKLNASVLTCNMVETDTDEDYVYCGGAWNVKGNKVSASLPLLTEGILVVDI